MKKFIKFPVIIFAVVLAASCGDSEKEPSLLDLAVSDAKEAAELRCKMLKEMKSGELSREDFSKFLAEHEEETKKIQEKYLYNADTPEYVKKAYDDQLKHEVSKCSEY